MTTYLVTGANRGIGLEITQRLADRGDQVIAAVRRPDTAASLRSLSNVRVEQLDVADVKSIPDLAGRLGGEPLDVLVNNAGVQNPDMTLDQVTLDGMDACYRINAVGPLLLTRALMPNLLAGARRTVVNISTNLASMARTGVDDPPGWYDYRASKAALNMLTRCLAAEFGSQKFTFVALHPGWVKTDMGGPQAPLERAESGEGIVSVLSELTPADNGRFLDWRGEELPW